MAQAKTRLYFPMLVLSERVKDQAGLLAGSSRQQLQLLERYTACDLTCQPAGGNKSMPSSRQAWAFSSPAASQHEKWGQANTVTHNRRNCVYSHELSLVLLQPAAGESWQGCANTQGRAAVGPPGENVGLRRGYVRISGTILGQM